MSTLDLSPWASVLKVKVKIGLSMIFQIIARSKIHWEVVSSYGAEPQRLHWVNIAEVGDLKAYFIQVFNRFKDNPSIPRRKKLAKAKINQNAEDQEELMWPLLLSKRTYGEVPKPGASRTASKSRPNRTGRKSGKTPSKKEQDLSIFQKSAIPVTILIGVAVIGGGWFAFASSLKRRLLKSRYSRYNADCRCGSVKSAIKSKRKHS